MLANLPLRLDPVLNGVAVVAALTLIKFVSSFGDLRYQSGRCLAQV
jgi:hypothetical protein